jgi:hypothetical protein
MGKRITLSRPRMESLAEESGARTDLSGPFLLVPDPVAFLPDVVRVTVEEVVTSVVAETMSTRGVAACAAVEEAAAVSTADFAGRLHPAANATAASTPASDKFVIGRFPEWLEAQSVYVASLSPRLLS